MIVGKVVGSVVSNAEERQVNRTEIHDRGAGASYES